MRKPRIGYPGALFTSSKPWSLAYILYYRKMTASRMAVGVTSTGAVNVPFDPRARVTASDMLSEDIYA